MLTDSLGQEFRQDVKGMPHNIWDLSWEDSRLGVSQQVGAVILGRPFTHMAGASASMT